MGNSGGLPLAEGLTWGSLEQRITVEGGTTARTRPPEWALCLVTKETERRSIKISTEWVRACDYVLFMRLCLVTY